MTHGQSENTEHPLHGAPRIGRIPDSLIDAVLDGEVDSRARREILAAARRNPQQRRELEETTDILMALRSPVPTPDLSNAVVAEVHRRRRYLPARVQRLVTRSRIAVAASLLLALLSYVGASRAWPDAPIFNTAPTPVAQVEQSLLSDAQRAATTLTRAQLPLPTVDAWLDISVSEKPATPSTAGSVAFDIEHTGFFSFPMPSEFGSTTQRNYAFTPVIRYVGSSASAQPQPLELNRDSKIP